MARTTIAPLVTPTVTEKILPQDATMDYRASDYDWTNDMLEAERYENGIDLGDSRYL